MIVYSGSVLGRWKKNWFCLTADGRLSYYDSQRGSPEKSWVVCAVCTAIRTSGDVSTFISRLYIYQVPAVMFIFDAMKIDLLDIIARDSS